MKALTASTPAGRKADLYFDFSPPMAANATHPQACVSALKFEVQAVLMGGVQSNISFNYAQLMINSITIRGHFMYEPGTPSELLGIIESGAFDLKRWETASYGFEEIEGFTFAAEHGGTCEMCVLIPVKD
ncbi:hypothetical protein MMC06_001831 [Schaereria dolodes]|nr:hypothetical protein [Schaereria dolodes]